MFGLSEGARSRNEQIYNSREVELERKPVGGEVYKNTYTVYSTIKKNEIDPCLLCQGLPEDPVTYCENKKHILCRKCYESLNDTLRSNCQICRQPASAEGMQSISTYEQLFENEELFCPAGCGMTFAQNILQDHFRECREFECDLCSFRGSEEEVAKHKIECRRQLLQTCIYCRQEYTFNNRQAHKNECAEFPVKADFPDGKERFVTRKSLPGVEFMTALTAGKRPRLQAITMTDGGEKKTCKCELSDESYKMLQRGVTAVADYLPQESQSGGSLTKVKARGVKARGDLVFFHSVFDSEWQITRRSRRLADRTIFVSDSGIFTDMFKLPVLSFNYDEEAEVPYIVNNMQLNFLGITDKMQSWDFVVRGLSKFRLNMLQTGKLDIYIDYGPGIIKSVLGLDCVNKLSKRETGSDPDNDSRTVSLTRLFSLVELASLKSHFKKEGKVKLVIVQDLNPLVI